MSIRSYVDELNSVKNEIKRNNEVNKKLRLRKKELEDEIADYLRNKEQNGLKYKGQAIILENKEKRKSKKKKQKELDVINLLQNLGLSQPEIVYEQILEVQKDEPILEQKIKIKNLSKF